MKYICEQNIKFCPWGSLHSNRAYWHFNMILRGELDFHKYTQLRNTFHSKGTTWAKTWKYEYMCSISGASSSSMEHRIHGEGWKDRLLSGCKGLCAGQSEFCKIKTSISQSVPKLTIFTWRFYRHPELTIYQVISLYFSWNLLLFLCFLTWFRPSPFLFWAVAFISCLSLPTLLILLFSYFRSDFSKMYIIWVHIKSTD